MIPETVSSQGLRARAKLLRKTGQDCAASHVEQAAEKIDMLEELVRQARIGLEPLAGGASLYRAERADVAVGLSRAGSFGREDHAPVIQVAHLRAAAATLSAIDAYLYPDMGQAGYVVASRKRTKGEDRYITLWRANAAGYAWSLPWAGLYTAEEAREHSWAPDDDYPETHSYAAPLSAIRPLFIAPMPGVIDNDTGPVLPNTPENWRLLGRLSAALHGRLEATA
ncbi:hypothetical protein KIKIMORA_00620 [Brevundimonas phage vB_BpoS-Kikimora]|uniref:Uncharacterized protein n=1 Tax=Brevundimonas phage vB_BpoS-Kikimora TaxID=2948601 RepID=A0A9E7MRP5_9CAUD|nr:hypothetical protein KIKIMORA_00620 [Brevundimonas phage vB_BpoS-Kikimora]